MEKKTVSEVMLTLLLMGMLTSAFNIQPVKTEPTTIIVPDDYPTIQEAINAANEGDTIFVRNGTYYEHVVVNKTVSLIGESRETTTIRGNFSIGSCVVNITANSVLITEFTIENGYYGIYLSSNNSIISSNKIIQYTPHHIWEICYGIWLQNSNNNTIAENFIHNVSYDGIRLLRSHSNVLKHNKIMNAGAHGMLLWYTTGNILKQNTILSNWIGLHLAAADRLNLIVENLIQGNDLGFAIGSFGNDNAFYHNNLVNNTRQVSVVSTQNNTWDNGYEGNYWSDYNGTDLDGDGIGDEYLPWEGVDYYPLMNPYWNPTDINHDLKVDIRDVATAALAYGSSPGHPNWNPHADITGVIYLEPDGKIDIRDIALIAINFGKTYQ